jgi:hypothetical protein
MRDFGKQVVLDLEIQSSNHPADEFIPWGEIGSGF